MFIPAYINKALKTGDLFSTIYCLIKIVQLSPLLSSFLATNMAKISTHYQAIWRKIRVVRIIASSWRPTAKRHFCWRDRLAPLQRLPEQRQTLCRVRRSSTKPGWKLLKIMFFRSNVPSADGLPINGRDFHAAITTARGKVVVDALIAAAANPELPEIKGLIISME